MSNPNTTAQIVLDWSTADCELAWRIMSILGVPDSVKQTMLTSVAQEIDVHRHRMEAWLAEWNSQIGITQTEKINGPLPQRNGF